VPPTTTQGRAEQQVRSGAGTFRGREIEEEARRQDAKRSSVHGRGPGAAGVCAPCVSRRKGRSPGSSLPLVLLADSGQEAAAEILQAGNQPSLIDAAAGKTQDQPIYRFQPQP
jgi:hypothetical protein